MAKADTSSEEYQCHYIKSFPSFPLKTKVGSQLPLTLTLGHSQECGLYFRPIIIIQVINWLLVHKNVGKWKNKAHKKFHLLG